MMAVEVLHAILHTHHRNTHIIAVGERKKKSTKEAKEEEEEDKEEEEEEEKEEEKEEEEKEEEKEEEEEEETAHIRSNNPHLTGGEKNPSCPHRFGESFCGHLGT